MFSFFNFWICFSFSYFSSIIYALNDDIKSGQLFTGQAGAVDEDTFIKAFDDVPDVTIFSAKNLEEQMKVIKDIVGDEKKDWKLRTETVSLEKFFLFIVKIISPVEFKFES